MAKEGKKYCFDFIRKGCLKWSDSFKRTLTKEMICMVPLGLRLPIYIPGEKYIPLRDYYGVEVDDVEDYIKQRDEYIDSLYIELKNKWNEIKKN